MIMHLTKSQKAAICDSCARFQVKTLYAFGSVVTRFFGPDSDVDLLMDFQSLNPFEYTDNYFALKFQLEQILKKPIDLLELKSLKNPFLQREIDRTKKTLYG